jgi:hypothetical protein
MGLECTEAKERCVLLSEYVNSITYKTLLYLFEAPAD